MAVTRSRVNRNIDMQTLILGVEPAELMVSSILLLLLLIVSNSLPITAIAGGATYVGLRAFKKGKPRGYPATVIRYAIEHRQYLAAHVADDDSRKNPFTPR